MSRAPKSEQDARGHGTFRPSPVPAVRRSESTNESWIDVAGELAPIVNDLRIGIALVLPDGTVGLRNPAAAAILSGSRGPMFEARLAALVMDVAKKGEPTEVVISGEHGAQRVRVRRAANAMHFVAVIEALPDSRAERRDVLPEEWRTAVVERLRAQLLRSEQLAAVGRVVAGLAHEVNNPLSALLCSIEMMQEIVAGTDRAIAPRSDASKNELSGLLCDCGTMVDRIRELMNAVRGMSRDRANDDVGFDPVRAIRDAARIFAIARRNSCHVDLSLQPLPALKGSPGRLGQVVLNLLQNGLDASAEGARLSVSAESKGSHVWITVAGIPTEVAPHVFEPFFTSKNVDKGTGLGLYICREIVTAMGGSIDFETSPAGTAFRVTLPAFLPRREL